MNCIPPMVITYICGRASGEKELEGAYYDVERNVAVRMTNLSTGEYYSRYWKQRQLYGR